MKLIYKSITYEELREHSKEYFIDLAGSGTKNHRGAPGLVKKTDFERAVSNSELNLWQRLTGAPFSKFFQLFQIKTCTRIILSDT